MSDQRSMSDEQRFTSSRRSVFAALSAAGSVVLSGVADKALAGAAAMSSPSLVDAFETEADLAASAVDATVRMIWLGGRRAAGHGSAWFIRDDAEDTRLPRLRAGDGSIWRLCPQAHLDIRQFGAAGDGLNDDTAAIQAAIDCALYDTNVPRTVFLPGGLYRTTNTLQIGYGTTYVSVELLGETFSHPNGREVVNSLILPDFWDRPCINLQGGRRVHLRRIGLRGVNDAHIETGYEGFADRTDRSLWFGDRLPQEADSRTAPYAGVCIDGYSGPVPARPYPDLPTPGFLPGASFYGRNFSSQTFIEDCQIGGFCVGIMVQPGRVPIASNGDFVTVSHSDISRNLTGMALANADARCNNLFNCRMHFNYTSLDGVNYGNGIGSFMGHVAGCSFDNNVNVMDLDISGIRPVGGGSPGFHDCYGESIYRIGRFLAKPDGAPRTIGFSQCKFQFSVKAREYSPIFLIEGRGGLAVFDRCTFMGAFGFFNCDCDVDMTGLALTQPVAAQPLEANTPTGCAAFSATMGVLAGADSRISLFPDMVFDMSWEFVPGKRPLLRGDRFPVSLDVGEGPRCLPIPWWASALFDRRDHAPVSPPPTFRLPKTAFASEAQVSGAMLSLIIADRDDDDIEAALALMDAGDIVSDGQTGHVYFVRSLGIGEDGRVSLTLRAMTAIRTFDMGQTYETAARIMPGEGELTVIIARRFHPADRLVRVTGHREDDELDLACPLTGSPPRRLYVEQGDISPPELHRARQSVGSVVVSSVEGTTGTIRLSGPMANDVDGPCPPFIRPTRRP